MVLDEEAERPPVDIFTSLPPPANVGRKSKVAVLVGSAILEFVLTGRARLGCMPRAWT